MPSKQTKNRPWIAFLDLLGTKNSSKITKSDYPNRIETFSRTIREQAEPLNSNVKIRFFSDSAYIECEDREQLFLFAKRIRQILFSQGIFFKSALVPGTLDDTAFLVQAENDLGYKIDIQGASFGEKAVGVYYNQENFKGIGYFIENPTDSSPQEGLTCQSAFPISEDLKVWRPFLDVSYHGTGLDRIIEDSSDTEKHENSLSFLNITLENALKANYQKRGLSRYYISNFLSVINSSDFSQLSYDSNSWKNIPPVFHHIVNSRRNRVNYSSLRGGAVIYLALINRVFSVVPNNGDKPRYLDTRTTSLCDRVLDEVFNTKLVSAISMKYPDAVISSDTLDGLIQRMVALKMRV